MHPLPYSVLMTGLSIHTGNKLDQEEYFQILESAFSLFSPAKHEVFMLLKDDNYSRWNKTEAFDAFIAEMDPYVM